MNLHVIGDEETVLGFALVGVSGTVAKSRDETRQALDRVLREGQAGLIFVTERLAAEIQDEIENLVLSGKFPLVLEIPDRRGPLGQRTKIRNIIGRAVGVKL